MKTPATFTLQIFLLGVILLALPASGWAQASKPGWSTDAAQSLAKAKAEKKLVLMDFTGSDWCGWCMKMDKEVFSTPEFIKYAQDNLVLLELDYPHKKFQAPQLVAQNKALQQQYGVQGFPTMVVLAPNGGRLQELGGYQEGGAKAFIAALDKLKAASATMTQTAPVTPTAPNTQTAANGSDYVHIHALQGQ